MEYCVFVEPQRGMSWPRLVAVAQHAERLGFDGFFRSDHYMPPHRAFTGEESVSDAWTTLAGLAVATRRIRLGTLVTPVTFRHPGALAIQVAGVDDMSGGRVELGLGAGWDRDEHEAYGIPFPAKRFGMLREALAIVSGLWATPAGGTFSFTGEHYSLDRAPGAQRPAAGHIPIIVGGSGATRTPALAAEYADEFNAGFADEATIGRRFEGARAAATAAGRDPGSLRLSAALTTTIATTRTGADERAASLGLDPAQQRSSGFHGTPGDVAERLDRLRGLGARRAYFQLLDARDESQLELIAEAAGLAGRSR